MAWCNVQPFLSGRVNSGARLNVYKALLAVKARKQVLLPHTLNPKPSRANSS